MISTSKLFELRFQIPFSMSNLNIQHQQNINKMTGQTALNKANRISTGSIAPQSNLGQTMIGKIRSHPTQKFKSLTNAYSQFL